MSFRKIFMEEPQLPPINLHRMLPAYLVGQRAILISEVPADGLKLPASPAARPATDTPPG